MPRRFDWGRLIAVLLMAILLTGCFTGALWGFSPEDDPSSDKTELVYDNKTEWSWGLFAKRVLLTPFTVVLDFLTCPVQAVLFGWDDDKDCDKMSKHKHQH